MIEPVTVDFETDEIQSRPKYPPKPVSVAIRHPGGRKEFFAWGQGSGNNCDIGKAAAVLRDVWRSKNPKLFHNGHFDLDVANTHFGLPVTSNIEDSMFLSFLNDPHERTIALKPMGEKYLGLPPEEQQDLRDWIIANGRKPDGKKIAKTTKDWGAYISQAPVKLVKPYALGDVDRTFQLWEHFRPKIIQRGMYPAYQRELSLLPLTLEMERSGIRVDAARLKKAAHIFADMDREIVKAIHKKLGIPKGSDFNVSSGPQLAKALIAADLLSARVLTPKGRQSTKISVLQDTCSDKRLLKLLAVHSVLEKYRNTFIEPWIAQAEQTGGRILTKFNQVKSKTADGGGGTRSGRFSSEAPNLQTVTANVEESKNKDVLRLMRQWLKDGYGFEFIGLRDYFLPDEGEYLISTDYNQQELRLLAHFEEGLLAQAYIKDPALDIHEYLGQEIYKVAGLPLERKAVKTVVFGVLYGEGNLKLSLALGISKQKAIAIKQALFRVLPGLEQLIDQLKEIARLDLPIRTYGGREYFCEPPLMWQGRKLTFEYKLLNYLIQASAADVTKQGMLNVAQTVPQVRIALQVHDELICMGHKKYGPKIAAAMCDMKFNIPMLADSKYSLESWARAA